MSGLSNLILIFIYFSISLLAQNIKIEISCEKQSYLISEPIAIGFTIKNVSNENISIRYFSIFGKRIIEIRHNNNILPYVGPLYTIVDAKIKLELKPNEEYFEIVQIDKHYGKFISIATPDRYFELGEYKVKFYISNENEKLESNELSFKVEYPEGEERIVYKKYFNIMTEIPTGKYKSVNEITELLLSIVESYSNSIYAPLVLVNIPGLFEFCLNNKKKSLELKKRLVEQYPWSCIVRGGIEGELNSMTSKVERLEFLEKLKIKSKNTLMEKFIEKTILETGKDEIK